MANVALQVIGSNNPPGPIEYAQSVIDEINGWLSDHPTIETEEDARAAKPFLDRAKFALEDVEKERDSKVRPLNEQVSAINAEYKAVHNTDSKKPGRFDKIVLELKSRVAAFMLREEQRRQREAEEARRAQEEAERIAREAEAREQEALANAKAGEVVDVAEVTQQADAAFEEFERQSRFAARAERDTRVKIGGGFAKAAGLRDVETLHLDSYNLALKAIGPNDKIRDAILSAARDYRKLHGDLPPGVSATYERKL
ncbi:hypothetical protein [Bradyrhizobium sp. Leo121]|uniref:hypothetical protein n=1 Tax=Bradyrhizobium sp. Leo121 TaxID=1571195 RepID=UPI00102A270B|nr:hypothetical protein [Bradyrhizobium sp. Leo121]RZN19493.1 hypothetical protein CWO90_35270 [Bradyrhizobium sp. Leo121]